MAAPGSEAAQPTGTAPDGQGQGQDRSFSSILGQDAFGSAPEELRPHLEEYVRTQVDPKLTQRFQDHAQFRQTWEPFSQIEGLTDLDPQHVDELVEFGYVFNAAANPDDPNHERAVEAFRENWEQWGEHFGFFEEGDDEPDGGEPPEDDRIAQLEAQLQEFRQEQQQGQMQQTQQQIQQEIRGHVEQLDLPGDPGSEKRQKAENAIYKFMLGYDDPNMSNEDVVKAAYEEYRELTGGAQTDLLEESEDVAAGQTLRGGRQDNSPEEIKGWDDADKAARARLMGANR